MEEGNCMDISLMSRSIGFRHSLQLRAEDLGFKVLGSSGVLGLGLEVLTTNSKTCTYL